MASAEHVKYEAVSLISAKLVAVCVSRGRGLNTAWAAIYFHNKVSLDPESNDMMGFHDTRGISSIFRKEFFPPMFSSGLSRDALVES